MKHFTLLPFEGVGNLWIKWSKIYTWDFENQINAFKGYRDYFNPNYYVLNKQNWAIYNNTEIGIPYLDETEIGSRHLDLKGSSPNKYVQIDNLNYHEALINNYTEDVIASCGSNQITWKQGEVIICLAREDGYADVASSPAHSDWSNYLKFPMNGGGGAYYTTIFDQADFAFQYKEKATDLLGSKAIFSFNFYPSRYFYEAAGHKNYMCPYSDDTSRENKLYWSMYSFYYTNNQLTAMIRDKNNAPWTMGTQLQHEWCLSHTSDYMGEEDFFIDDEGVSDTTKVDNIATPLYSITVKKDANTYLPIRVAVKIY